MLYFESENESLGTLDVKVPKSHMLTDILALERTHVASFNV